MLTPLPQGPSSGSLFSPHPHPHPSVWAHSLRGSPQGPSLTKGHGACVGAPVPLGTAGGLAGWRPRDFVEVALDCQAARQCRLVVGLWRRGHFFT